jgi:hypothetical protein
MPDVEASRFARFFRVSWVGFGREMVARIGWVQVLAQKPQPDCTSRELNFLRTVHKGFWRPRFPWFL